MPEWEPIRSPFTPLQKAVFARLNLHPATTGIAVFDTEPVAGSDAQEAPALGEAFLVMELPSTDTEDTDDGTLYDATVRITAHHVTRGAGSPAPVYDALEAAETALTARPLSIESIGEQALVHEGAQRLPTDGAGGKTRRRATLDLSFSHYATR